MKLMMKRGGSKGIFSARKGLLLIVLPGFSPRLGVAHFVRKRRRKKKLQTMTLSVCMRGCGGGGRILGKALMCFLLEKSAELVRV